MRQKPFKKVVTELRFLTQLGASQIRILKWFKIGKFHENREQIKNNLGSFSVKDQYLCFDLPGK